MHSPRKRRACAPGTGEAEDASGIFGRIPPDVIDLCLSMACMRSFACATQTCRRLRAHAFRPAASPSAIWCRFHPSAAVPSCGVRDVVAGVCERRMCRSAADSVPESLLRLRPRILVMASTLLPRHLAQIAGRMSVALRNLTLATDRQTMFEWSALTPLSALETLRITGGIQPLDASVMQLARLQTVHVNVRIADVPFLPPTVRSIRSLAPFVRRATGREPGWEALMKLPLTALHLHMNLTDAAATVLGARCTSLKDLGVTYCASFAPLAAIGLVRLRAVVCRFVRQGADDHLSRLTTLRTLTMEGQWHANNIRRVMASLTRLRSLEFDGVRFSNDDVRVLGERAHSQLARLIIRGEYEGSVQRAALDYRPLSVLTNLRTLALLNCNVSAAHLPAPLPKLARLTIECASRRAVFASAAAAAAAAAPATGVPPSAGASIDLDAASRADKEQSTALVTQLYPQLAAVGI